MEADSFEQNPVTRVGPYRVHRKIGEGASGWVFEVSRDSERCALKLLKPWAVESAAQQDRRARFMREIELLERCSHPALLRVLDAGEAPLVELADGSSFEALIFYTMPLLPTNLEERVLRRRPMQAALAESEVISMVVSVLDATSVLHDGGIVHRDIKPSNILLCEAGSAYLADLREDLLRAFRVPPRALLPERIDRVAGISIVSLREEETSVSQKFEIEYQGRRAILEALAGRSDVDRDVEETAREIARHFEALRGIGDSSWPVLGTFECPRVETLDGVIDRVAFASVSPPLRTLRDVWQPRGDRTVLSHAIRKLLPVLAGLGRLHRRGFAHGRLSIDRLLVDHDGGIRLGRMRIARVDERDSPTLAGIDPRLWDAPEAHLGGCAAAGVWLGIGHAARISYVSS